MTADKITETFEKGGMQVASPSEIESQVGEYMREDWFKEYPLENLIYDGIYRQKYIAEERWV